MNSQFKLTVLVGWLLATVPLAAQQSDAVLARLGYPQTILYNGNILTMDDASFASTVGTRAQALAIRDGKILAIGQNADIRALKGPQTQEIDLRGRTVVPGFVTVHNHPQDWAHVVPKIVQKAVPEDVMIGVYLEGAPQKQMEEFPKRLQEAVKRAKPGVWIYGVLTWNPSPDPEDPFLNWAGTLITKQMLDTIAPNNPVLVRGRSVLGYGNLDGVLNQRAVEEIRKYGLKDLLLDMRPGRGLRNLEQEEKTGVMSGLEVYRMAIPEVIFRNAFEAYTEMLRLDISWWASIGQTTVAGFLYHYPTVLKAHRVLDRRGQLANRIAWGWGEVPDPAWERAFKDPFLVADLASREGEGTDHMWYLGTGQIGGGCISAEPLPNRPEGQRLIMRGGGGCGSYKRGSVVWNSLFELVKNGGRLIGSHQTGDVDIDNIMTLVEEASKAGGLSPEQIRARRHTADHMHAWPRPDQIPRLKNLGMITGGTERFIALDSPYLLRDYGEKVLEWVVPRGSLVRSQIMSGIEIDKPYELVEANAFTDLYWAISRKAYDGKVYAPDQKISREIALKTATIWPAHYVLRENLIGSLAPGKFADLLVLDKDYLTIPEADIPSIRILGTMVGGKVEHLVPSMAKEWGMSPRGAAVELGGYPAKY
jgi:predicted amidohydrolase YtcJ